MSVQQQKSDKMTSEIPQAITMAMAMAAQYALDDWSAWKRLLQLQHLLRKLPQPHLLIFSDSMFWSELWRRYQTPLHHHWLLLWLLVCLSQIAVFEDFVRLFPDLTLLVNPSSYIAWARKVLWLLSLSSEGLFCTNILSSVQSWDWDNLCSSHHRFSQHDPLAPVCYRFSEDNVPVDNDYFFLSNRCLYFSLIML